MELVAWHRKRGVFMQPTQFKLQLYERPKDGTIDVAFFTKEWGQDIYRYDGRLVMLKDAAENLVSMISSMASQTIVERKVRKAAATDNLPPVEDWDDSHREGCS
jgi:hypothetical protein